MSASSKTESSHNAPTRRSAIQAFDMDDSETLTAYKDDARASTATGERKHGLPGVARHTLGLILLLFVVFLWTMSSFLGSSIFADDSYAKPFFLTYLNTSLFTLCILPRFAQGAYEKQKQGVLGATIRSTISIRTFRTFWRKDGSKEYMPVDEEESFLKLDSSIASTTSVALEEHLGLLPTARLSLGFCILWFAANYFAMACLQYTTVASTTILNSTSSAWTLMIGALTGTEKFTWRKLCGVLASLAGIMLISQADLRGQDKEAGNTRRALDEFPDKSPYELALGDALALLSAVIYAFYTINLKKTTISALPKSIHMPTFFGFVGFFNTILLLPLFPLLHYTSLERFALPPNFHIWMILLVNSVGSLLSDICWAYAMLLTSPLVATVGLSLTIPLSLVGEMIIQGRFESLVHWVGASIVVGSFVFVEREEKEEEVVAGEDDEEEDMDIGEPGPAIVIEDCDEVQEESGRSRDVGPSSLLMEMDEGDMRSRDS